MIAGLWHNYPAQAAAGLWTTPSELALYCIAIQHTLQENTGALLSKETVEMMLTKDKNEWGLGPQLRGSGDSLIFQHGGKNEGFTNQLMAFAQRGNAVIVMTNGDGGIRLIGEVLRAVSNSYGWGLVNQKVVEPVALASDALHKFTGKYKYPEQVPGIGDYLIEVKEEGAQLIVVDPNDNDRLTLVPLAGQKFIDVDKGDEISFKESEDGEALFLLWGNSVPYKKVE